jgi:hypothetical protein
MFKKLFVIFVVLMLILAGAGYYGFSNLDRLIKTAVEKYGSQATQTDVKLNSVKLLVATGEGSLSGLSIGNPSGFTSPTALFLGSISVKLDIGTIRGTGPIIIKEIIVERPQVNYEINESGKNNFKTIEDNTNKYASSTAGKKSTTPATETSAPGRKIIIKDLIIRDGQISISQPLLKTGAIASELPLIHLTNIGESSNGATAAQIAEQVLGAITSSATKVATSNITKQLGNLKNISGKEDIKDVGKSLKGLFGK